MNIKPFAVEEWMNAYEDGARYNIAETCVDSVSLDELFARGRGQAGIFGALLRKKADLRRHCGKRGPARGCLRAL